jgi:chitinase
LDNPSLYEVMISTTFTVMILSTLVATAPITITLLVPAPTSTLEDVAAPDPAFSAAYINAPNATLPGLTITMTLTETPSVATSTSAMWVPLSSESVEPATSTAPFLAAVTAPTPAPGGQIVAAYYPDWAGPDFPPEKIDFGRFDWIDFAFALPNEQFGLNWDNDDMAPKLLHRLVTAAHAKGKKVKLSVGGWTGSK